ncbi:1297_t:CDS:2 [Ambispora gerdemannii]|uniref:Dolichyl-diphosphooligosaccharide--protein glycosyltransferase subunit 1 n=1 Tax=Ambispora gerdemannii TaxID=144530 RepID=A0A9N9CBY4_9GLOM|nr:1297_t:CDS:2 [Ambispora gerdemannii]
MRLFSIFSLVCTTVLIVCTAVFSSSAIIIPTPVNIPQHWLNNNILRTIDLTSPIVRETTVIIAQNVHNDLVGEYHFPVKEKLDKNLAWIEAKERKTDIVFDVEKVEFDSINHIQYYKITFDRRVEPQEKITLIIKTVFTHILTPVPYEIPQTGRQYLVYEGSQYANSAYLSEKQKTNIKLAFSTLMSYTQRENKVNRNEKLITYGFYNNIAPDAYDELKVHYGFQRPIFTVKRFRRDLEVSHWGGNLAIEEHIDLKHDGAKLKGQFSRLEYQQTSLYGHQDSTAARDLQLLLPPRASDVYYRDEVGNVSTSTFRNERDRSVLDFKPRYPLFGGWNYTWNHGYNVPLSDFVRYHPKSDRYILNVPFLRAFTQTMYDKVQVRVMLPEGAKNVKVDIPFSLDKLTHGVFKTNLDTTGRYLVVLEKTNVVDEHFENFQISYTYDNLELLRKPFVVSGFFFAGAPWDIVTLAFWMRYPNPFASHVLSVDVIDRHVDPTSGMLRTTRLILKKGKVPSWGIGLIRTPEAYILEESIVDPHTKTMITRTKNITHVRKMQVEEWQTFRVDSQNNECTKVKIEAKIISKFGWSPLSERIEGFGLKKFADNTATSRMGMSHVLEMIRENQRLRSRRGFMSA